MEGEVYRGILQLGISRWSSPYPLSVVSSFPRRWPSFIVATAPLLAYPDGHEEHHEDTGSDDDEGPCYGGPSGEEEGCGRGTYGAFDGDQDQILLPYLNMISSVGP